MHDSDISAHRELPAEVSDSRLWTRRLLLLLAILLGLGAMRVGAAVLVPLAAALVLYLWVNPAVKGLAKRGVPRTLSALILMLGLLVLVIGPVTAVLQPLIEWISPDPAVDRWASVTERAPWLGRWASNLGQGAGAEVATAVFGGTGTVVVSLGLAWVLGLFLLLSGDAVRRKSVQMMPTFSLRRQALVTLGEMEQNVSQYVVTLVMINTGLGVVTWAVMSVLGLPNAVMLGVLAGVLNFAPYVGPLIAAVVIALTALISPAGSWGLALGGGIAFVGLNIMEGYIVTPTVMGRRLSLNPVAILVGLLLFGWAWGLPGLLLAVPLLVCVKSLSEHVASLAVVDVLLGEVRIQVRRKPEQSGWLTRTGYEFAAVYGLLARAGGYLVAGLASIVSGVQWLSNQDWLAPVRAVLLNGEVGGILLSILGSGLVAYALWRWAEAATNAQVVTLEGWAGWGRRGFAAVTGALHMVAGLLLMAAALNRPGSRGRAAEDTLRWMLSERVGAALTLVGGAALIVFGLLYLWKAWREATTPSLSAAGTKRAWMSWRLLWTGTLMRGFATLTIGLVMVPLAWVYRPSPDNSVWPVLEDVGRSTPGAIWLIMLGLATTGFAVTELLTGWRHLRRTTLRRPRSEPDAIDTSLPMTPAVHRAAQSPTS